MNPRISPVPTPTPPFTGISRIPTVTQTPGPVIGLQYVPPGPPPPPPGAVRGVFSFGGTTTGLIPSSVLTKLGIKGVSLGFQWSDIETADGTYNWTLVDSVLAQVAGAGLKIMLRLGGQGNPAAHGGSLPNWLFTLLGADPTQYPIVPGATYVFNDGVSPNCPDGVRLNPVLWNTTYLAKKLAFIAASWAHIATLSTTIKNAISHTNVPLCEFQHDDWAFPSHTTVDHTGGPDVLTNPPGTGYDRSELNRWSDSVGAGGAGYTSALMLGQMQQIITATKNATTSALGRSIPMVGPFSSNTGNLDAAAAAAETPPYPYTPIWLIHAVNDWANTTYPGLFMLARYSVAACKMQDANAVSVGGATWYWIQNALAGRRNFGQMLWNSNGDTSYRNNGGTANNCKFGINPRYPNPTSTYQDINDQSFDHAGPTAIGYANEALEIYQGDVIALDMTYGQSVLGG